MTHSFWVDTTSGDIQAQLAHRDAHPANTQVTQAKDTAPIRNETDLHFVLVQPRFKVSNDLGKVGQVGQGEVERFHG